MGLDVYCRWPGMTDEERKTQFTGFRTEGKVGYLRQSWGSLEAWNEIFKFLFPFDWTDAIYPRWDGYNDGEGPDLSDPKERKRLEENKEILKEYVKLPRPIKDDLLRRYFSHGTTQEDAKEIVKQECQEIIDFIDLALSKNGAQIEFS